MDLEKVHISKVREAVTTHLDELKRQLEVTNAALEVIKTFEGKQITKRIGTAVQKALPDFTVYYGKPYGWYEVKIWGNGIEFGSGVSLLLAYREKSGTNLDFEEVLEKNRRYTLNENRIRELEHMLPYLPGLCDRWNAILDEINQLRAELEPKQRDPELLGAVYPLSEIFRLSQDHRHKYGR